MATRIKPQFNCLDEDWIPVIYSDGACAKISLKRVFKDSLRIVDICGSTITQMSVLGLLRALVYDAFKDSLLTDDLWRHGYKVFTKRMMEYVDIRYDDFYLYHPKKPLFQDASLTPAVVEQVWKRVAKKDVSSSIETDKFNAVSPLILTTKPYGTASIGFTDLIAKTEYSDAELALLLLEHQFYHIIDTKDVRKKPKGEYSPYLMRGGLHALFSGGNLAETIWLNIPTNESSIIRPSGKLHLTYNHELEQKQSYSNQIMPLTRRILISREPVLNVLLVHGYDCGNSLPDTWMMATKSKLKKGVKSKQQSTDDIPASDVVYDKFAPYIKGNFGIRYIDSLCVIPQSSEIKADVDWRACKHINANIARNRDYCKKIGSHASIKCYAVMCETKAFGQAFSGDSNMMVSDVIFDITINIEMLNSLIKVCEAFSDIIYKTIDIYCNAIKEKTDKQRKERSMSVPGMNKVIDSCKRKWWIYVDTHVEHMCRMAIKMYKDELSISSLHAIGKMMHDRNSGCDILKTILMREIPSNSSRGCIALGKAMNSFNAMVNKIFTTGDNKNG